MTSEEIKNDILSVLRCNNRWMTATEIISWANIKGITGCKHDGNRAARSHPYYRILTAMINKDDKHNVYVPELVRRIRTTGSEIGSYEYAFKGISNVIKRYIFHYISIKNN